MVRKPRSQATAPAVWRPGIAQSTTATSVVITNRGRTEDLRSHRLATGSTFEFRTAMGEPEVGSEMEVRLAERSRSRHSSVDGQSALRHVRVTSLSPAGRLRAAQIATHPDFPHGTNVELVKVLNEHEIDVRFCERGVGETMSSGTGSSAAAAASIHAGRVKSPVRVHAPGGTQTVEWDGELLLLWACDDTLSRRFFRLR